MKTKITFLLAAFLMLSVISFSQAPNSFKFQTMVRKLDGSALINQSVKARISIIKGSTSGNAVYSELHSATSNSFGIININIGEGSLISGSVSSIDWSVDSYFVKIEMDETGGANYSLSSISQLLSVPYALTANSVNSIDWSKVQNKPTLFSGSYTDLTSKPSLFSGSYADLTNKPTLFSGSYSDLTNKPTDIAKKNYVDSLIAVIKANPLPSVDFGYGIDFSTSSSYNYLSVTDASSSIPSNSTYSWVFDGSSASTSTYFSSKSFSKSDGAHTLGLKITTPDGNSYSKSKVFQIKNNAVISSDFPADTSKKSQPIADFSYSVTYANDSSSVTIGFSDASNNTGTNSYSSYWYINGVKFYTVNGSGFAIYDHRSNTTSKTNNGHYSISHEIIVNGSTYSKYKEFDISGIK